MKNTFLALVVVVTLVGGGLGGAFAGFVDTEVSQDNFYQAGMTDLLVNGANDPDVDTKLQFSHGVPGKSADFFIDLYNWGECSGGDVYMHYKDIDSREDGRKLHLGDEYCYDGVTAGTGWPGIPDGYRVCAAPEPEGAGVWSTEPEKCAEVGDCLIAQYYIDDAHPGLLGEDYASGVSDHLDVVTVVCDDPGPDGDGILDDCDTNGDGVIDGTERAAHNWVPIPSLTGKLATIASNKDLLGFLPTQQFAWVHVDVTLQQLADPLYDGTTCCDYDGDGDIDGDDEQKKWWPTNALQGDIAEWDMEFELTTDP